MPNHVYASISGISTKEDCKLFTDIAKTHRGLAGYLIPFPKELDNTSSPVTILSEEAYLKQEKEKEANPKEKIFSSGITQEMSDDYKDRFLFDNWYDWNHHNYGTKWGCYDNEFDITKGCYRFTTAWSPLSNDLIEKLAKIFPSFIYTYEEETGWGGWMKFEDGVCIEETTFDCPNWYEEDFTFYINNFGIIKREDDIPSGINLNDDRRKFPNEYDNNGGQWKYVVNLTKLVEPHSNLDETYEVGYYEEYDLNVFYGSTIKEALQTATKDFQNQVNLNPMIWG